MKIPFLLALIFTASICHAQNPPAMQKQKQVLFDFRTTRRNAQPKIPLATQKSILSQVFPKYLTDDNKCNSQLDMSGFSDPLKAARTAGQIVPIVSDIASGSFTAAGQTQTAYLISVNECFASHADNYGTQRIAIFSGQRLLANIDVDFKSSIILKTDLNSDGVNELLLTGGDLHQGILTEIAALVEFQNGRMRVVQNFGAVVEDSCGAQMSDGSSKVAILYLSDVEPGKMPRFRQENYVSDCRTTKRWRLLSTGRMPD
ncbi:MAG: hypothetical protein ABR555_09840 [Pyrinomonadaceae bacterium]